MVMASSHGSNHARESGALTSVRHPDADVRGKGPLEHGIDTLNKSTSDMASEE